MPEVESLPQETTSSEGTDNALAEAQQKDPEYQAWITGDWGTTFPSQLWTLFANLRGITLHQTTFYNPAANGMVEHFHRTLKVVFMSGCMNSNWFTQLPWVLLGLRTTSKDGLDVSAALIVYSDLLVAPAKYFPSATSSDYLQRLRHVVGKFTPCRQTQQPPVKQHIR
ncbi:uncharacterized protein [Palaemon carinicauda]|uniref:uncharacterized protein n=1 Tax=Palaemon carinicauda TaxID=392227 RepID=UPI0035B5FAEE